MNINKMRSILFCPSLNEEMMIKTKRFMPDCIMFDLEDSVSIEDKDKSRKVLKNVFDNNDFEGFNIFVRINGLDTPWYKDDLNIVAKSKVQAIRLPMCETAKDIITLDNHLATLEKKNNLPNNYIGIQCSIESPLGVKNVSEIINASTRVMSVSFGTEDYTNSLGVSRTKDFNQFLYARSRIAIAASIKKIPVIDTVFSDFNDTDGLEKETIHIQSLGFSGKSCIHPKQVGIVNKVFSPSEEEIEYAKKVIDATNKKNTGVFQINGKMIDKPIIEKAIKILAKANLLN